MATEFQETKLYGGKVTVRFYPNFHMYKVTDEENGVLNELVTGVTTYLGIKDKSAALVSWATETTGLHLYDILASCETITMDDVREAINKHRKIKDEAAEIGTKMHEWCEYFIKHKLGREGYEKKPEMPDNTQIALGVNSFLEWYMAHNVQFVDSERVVYSRKHRYIGTMDFDAYVDGVRTAGDFKSSNGLYNSVLAQLSGYAEAREEEAAYLGEPFQYENRTAVRLAKETEDEYNLRMERKNIIKNKEGEPYEPYNPFEWLLFEGRELHKRDLEAFFTHKALHTWDKETDLYKNK